MGSCQGCQGSSLSVGVGSIDVFGTWDPQWVELRCLEHALLCATGFVCEAPEQIQARWAAGVDSPTHAEVLTDMVEVCVYLELQSIPPIPLQPFRGKECVSPGGTQVGCSTEMNSQH